MNAALSVQFVESAVAEVLVGGTELGVEVEETGLGVAVIAGGAAVLFAVQAESRKTNKISRRNVFWNMPNLLNGYE